jgi:hypothetical protein
MHAAARELLQHHGFVREGAAAAAVLLGQVGEHDPGAAGICPGLRVGAAVLAPARLLRNELLLDELGDRLAEHAHVVVHPGRLVSGEGNLQPIHGGGRPRR